MRQVCGDIKTMVAHQDMTAVSFYIVSTVGSNVYYGVIYIPRFFKPGGGQLQAGAHLVS